MTNDPVAIYQAILCDIEPYLKETPDGFLQEGPPYFVKRAACESLRAGFLKKLEVYSEEAETRALDTFMASNKKCHGWVSPSVRTDLTESDMLLWNQFKDCVYHFFSDPCGKDAVLSLPNIAENARSGPGAAVGSNGTSFYSKHFSGPLTATSQFLVDVYKADVGLWPEFSNAEIIRQENFGSPTIVLGSKTSFVPKTVETARMICVEPIVNMYLQLGAGEIISKRLHRLLGIDLATQPTINRLLAYYGSVIDATFGDGFATIDLSSASDSLSLRLINEIVPEEEFQILYSLRSQRTDVRGRYCRADCVDLNMFSTMGNGFTFPLQTALFACAASACVHLDDGLRSYPKSFGFMGNGLYSVFGDDIVVRSGFASRLERLLTLMGCEVNKQKSFSSGSFRESCGHDYYCGHNIRPVYCRKIKTDADITVLSNLLMEWSLRNGIALPKAQELLITSIREPFVVPRSETEDAGLRLPYDLVRRLHGKGRRVAVNQNYSLVYQARSPSPRRIRLGEGTIRVPPGLKWHIYNPSGLLMAFLRGEVRRGYISINTTGVVPYRTKRRVSPNWDYIPASLEDRLIGPSSAGSTYRTGWYEANLTPKAWRHIRTFILGAPVRKGAGKPRKR